MFAGFGADDLHGGYGPDHVFAVAKDAQLDKVDCGSGRDVATIRAGEPTVVVNCERVEVRNDASASEPGESETSEGP